MGNEFSSFCIPGLRFKPTDYELLGYLLWKKQGDPIANIIKEIPQDKCNPDELERECDPM